MRIPGLPPSSAPPPSGGDSDKQAALDALNKMYEIIRKIELNSKFGNCDVSKKDISALQSALSKIHQALDEEGPNLRALGPTSSLLKSLDSSIQYIAESAERGDGNAYDIDTRRIGLLSGTITDLQDQLK